MVLLLYCHGFSLRLRFVPVSPPWPLSQPALLRSTIGVSMRFLNACHIMDEATAFFTALP